MSLRRYYIKGRSEELNIFDFKTQKFLATYSQQIGISQVCSYISDFVMYSFLIGHFTTTNSMANYLFHTFINQ